MKKLLLILLVATGFGCGAGETPTETYEKPAASTDNSQGGAIQNNPNLPPAAKDAIIGGGSK